MGVRRPDGFYSPGQVKLLLWRYDELLVLSRTIAQPDRETARIQRSVKDIGEGGFEDGLCLKADLDNALAGLDPVVRRVVWDYYVVGLSAVEVAAALHGANRWFVDRARHRGIRQMALSLGWRPALKNATLPYDLDAYLADVAIQDLGPAGLRERMAMIVARALSSCPAEGPHGMRCPVLDCHATFAWDNGQHFLPHAS
jgi:hypothetical protein